MLVKVCRMSIHAIWGLDGQLGLGIRGSDCSEKGLLWGETENRNRAGLLGGLMENAHISLSGAAESLGSASESWRLLVGVTEGSRSSRWLRGLLGGVREALGETKLRGVLGGIAENSRSYRLLRKLLSDDRLRLL